MKITLSQKLFIFLIIVLIIMGLTGYAFYKSNQKMAESGQWVQHTEQVIQQTGNILSASREMQASSRSFMLTNDSAFLQTLTAAPDTAFAHIAQLKLLTADNPRQQTRIDSLNLYVHNCLAVSRKMVEQKGERGSGPAYSYIALQQSNQCTDCIYNVAHAIQTDEDSMLVARKLISLHSVARFNYLLWALYGVMVFFTLLVSINMLNNWQQHKHATSTKEINIELERRMLERSVELKRQERRLVLQNEENEDQADELVLANQELLLQTREQRKERLQSENRLAKAQQVAHMGSWELDFKTKTILLSDEACRIVGINIKTNKDALVFYESFIHPDDIEFVLNLIKDSYQSLSDTSFEHRIVRKDGTVRYIHSESKFEVDLKGEPVGLYGIAHDITDKKLAADQLVFDHNNLESLINNTDDLMWSVDLHFRLITFNKAMEQVVASASGKPVTKGMNLLSTAFPVEQLNKYQRFYERAFLGESFTEVEYFSTPVEYWAEMSFRPIRSGNEVIGTACQLHNITKMEKAKNEIKQLNETLEQRVTERTRKLAEANIASEAFSYSVSHDLRAPVRSVIGFTGLIGKEFGSGMSERQAELFGFISKSGKQMSTIIEDLLKLAKYSKEELHRVEVDLTALVKSVWANINQASPHKAVLELGQLPVVEADESMLTQAIVNLISNAIKYSSKKEHPVVKVWCCQNAEDSTIFITDNGAGFDMKNYDRLFGAFQRLHGANEFEGTGVGLMLVKSIFEKHGWTIAAESKVDKGATFYFTIPAREICENKNGGPC